MHVRQSLHKRNTPVISSSISQEFKSHITVFLKVRHFPLRESIV